MKKIIIHGHCSARYKWPTWPDFLHLYDDEQRSPIKKYINLARPGSGNESIARDVINSVLKYRDIDHMYIMWGAPHRHEVISETTEKIDNTKLTWSMWDPDFEWTVSYNGEWKAEQNQKLDRYKTLENILYAQTILEKHNIKYTMMIYDKRSLPKGLKTNSERALEKQIDWKKFKFYKDQLGLRDFAQELYPDQFPDYNVNSTDPHTHPLPYAHYKWMKDIVFESDIEVPMPMYSKLKSWKTAGIPDKEWMDPAKVVPPWENNA